MSASSCPIRYMISWTINVAQKRLLTKHYNAHKCGSCRLRVDSYVFCTENACRTQCV